MTSNPSLFAGGGVMGALMRDRDWSTTSLGPREHWPHSLIVLMRVMLSSRQPMFIAWGADRTLVYNDSYAPMLGARHPAALGRPFFETWPEVRDEVGSLMNRVFAGDPVHMDDLQLTLHRNGYPEEAHFAFSYTPVPGEDGSVIGLFCACTETTRQVLTERKAASERQRQQALLQQMPEFVAVLRGREHVFEYVNDAYIAVAGERDYLGRSVIRRHRAGAPTRATAPDACPNVGPRPTAFPPTHTAVPSQARRLAAPEPSCSYVFLTETARYRGGVFVMARSAPGRVANSPSPGPSGGRPNAASA